MLFHTRINTSVLDRIVINEGDYEVIHAFLDKHFPIGSTEIDELKSKVCDIDLSFSNKGLFTTKIKKPIEGELTYYYDITSKNKVVLCELDGEEMAYKIVFDIVDNELKVSSLILFAGRYKRNESFVKSTIEKSSRATLTMIVSFIMYSQAMIYFKSENKYTIKRASINKPKGKTKKQLQREARELARRKVSVSKEQNTYDYSEATREGEKRMYERHTDSWYSRGYWRRRSKKDDTRIWVEGKEKKAQNGSGEKVGKDFTV